MEDARKATSEERGTETERETAEQSGGREARDDCGTQIKTGDRRRRSAATAASE